MPVVVDGAPTRTSSLPSLHDLSGETCRPVCLAVVTKKIGRVRGGVVPWCDTDTYVHGHHLCMLFLFDRWLSLTGDFWGSVTV